MSYTKHTWVDGELVTAAKMNNIENGIEEAASGGGVLVVHNVDGTLDKTWQQIHDSDFAVLKYPDGSIFLITGSNEEDGEYFVGFFTYGSSPSTYVAQTASGYPVIANH